MRSAQKEMGHPGVGTAFNRWLIPLAAVLIHICIGSVYSWSIFNRPILALLPNQSWWFSPPYTTFSTALVCLGLSAAFGGPWVERRGPRAAATVAALLFGSGLILGGIGLDRQDSDTGLSWDGRYRRNGMRARLHLSSQHACEVVSGPPWNGDGHGDHGLWRRRLYCRLS